MENPEMTLPHMGLKLRKLLEAKHMNQSALAKALGMSRQNISVMVDLPVIQARTLLRVAQVLEVPLLFFYEP